MKDQKLRKSSEDNSTESTVSNIGRRTLLLSGQITDSILGDFLAEFFALTASKGPITLKLYSEGGDITAGFAIYDAIRSVSNKVSIIGYGEISSIAALIFMAGDNRLMTRNCRWMVHQGSIEWGSMDFKSLMVRVGELKHLDDRYTEIISERSSIPILKMKSLVKAETFLSAQQCVALRIAHGIVPEKP